MAEVYGLTVEVGERATVSVVAGLVKDIEALTAGAAELAEHVARGEASDRVSAILREGGVQAVLAVARERRISEDFGRERQALLEFERAWDEWRRSPSSRHPWPKRARQEGLFLALVGPEPLRFHLLRLLDALHADEFARALPQEPYRFESVSYSNPLGAEIVAEAGAAAVALAALLRVIRDWGPRRRQESAVADDMKDQARCRAKLRQMILQKVAAGELPISSTEAEAVISGQLTGAVDRLGRRQADFYQTLDPQGQEDSDPTAGA